MLQILILDQVCDPLHWHSCHPIKLTTSVWYLQNREKGETRERQRREKGETSQLKTWNELYVCYCFNLLGSQVNGIWQLALEGLGILKQFADKKSFWIMKFVINHDDRFCFLSLWVIKALSQFTAAGLLINLILESRIIKTWDLDTYSPF